jgi:sulfite exporter TauE/SafE
MLEIISLLAVGFLLGLEHSLDSDHLAAISTMSTRSGSLKKALVAGLYWGVGHTGMLFFTGIIVLSSHLTISEKFRSGLEIIVGCMLIFLGIKNILGYKKNLIHTHEDGKIHAHPHAHEHEKIYHHPSLWIGMIHGLAGSAALMLMILASIKSLSLGLLYILIFGLGTIWGMGLMSFLMSTPSIFLKNKFPRIEAALPVATGILSIVIGIEHIYTIL